MEFTKRFIRYYRNSINPPYSRKDIPSVVLSTLAFISIPIVLLFFLSQPSSNGESTDVEARSTPFKVESRIKSQRKFLKNEFLVKFSPKGLKSLGGKKTPKTENTGVKGLDKLNRKFDVDKMEKITDKDAKSKDLDRWYVIKLDEKEEIAQGNEEEVEVDEGRVEDLTLQAVLDSYEDLNVVESVEPNYVANVSKVPNDLYFSTRKIFSDHDDLWGLKKIGAEKAWDVTTGNSVVVAVVDTGVDYTHPDLANQIFRDSNGEIVGYDYNNNDSNPMDDHFHGTHVAGIIAAQGNNDANHSVDSGKRLVGVGWDLKIMPIKALSASGSGYSDDLIKALKFAADNGAKVVNNSWGCDFATDIFSDAIKYLHDRGVVAVFAAGNETIDVSESSPAGDKYAITVGASNFKDKRAWFSNLGARMDFLAPGGDWIWPDFHDYILSARLKNAKEIPGTLGSYYAIARGTSMAAPHVSGAAALVLAAHPDFSVEEVRQTLRNTADKVNNKSWSSSAGFGRINVGKAVSVTSAPPVARITLPENTIIKKTNLSITGKISARSGIPNWKLYIGKGSDPASWILLKSGNSAISGTLATINSSKYTFSAYTLKLEVTATGNGKSTDYLAVKADKQLKSGWPKELSSYGQPAIGDIDGDGRNEIVMDNGNQIHALHTDGSSVVGFPIYVNVPNAFYTYIEDPVLADIDGDKISEIVLTTHSVWAPPVKAYSRVFVYKGDGSLLPGWPAAVPSEIGVHAPPTVADINADGKPEILINAQKTGKIYAYKTNGSVLNGWPVTTASVKSISPSLGAVAAANVRGDKKMEIFVGNYNGKVYGFNSNGSRLSGWPRSISSHPINATVGIVDINSDGKKEILAKAVAESPDYKGRIVALGGNGKILWSKSIGQSGPGLGAASPAFVNLTTNSGIESFWPIEIDFKGDPGFLGLTSKGSQLSGWPGKNFGGSFGAVSVADLTGDGISEVITQVNGVFDFKYLCIQAVNYKGQVVWGRNYAWGCSSASIGDLDGNGKLDMVVSTGWPNYMTYVWEFQTKVPANSLIWSQYMGNAQHTGIGTSAKKGSAPVGSPKPSGGKLGDLNGDNLINIRDLSILLSRWGSTNRTADINGDGLVNIRDLSILLSRWGR